MAWRGILKRLTTELHKSTVDLNYKTDILMILVRLTIRLWVVSCYVQNALQLSTARLSRGSQ